MGVQSELELAFASLHQLCAPLLDRLERLPAPQRDALGVAFGLRGGGAPDRFLVGLAVLTLRRRRSGRCCVWSMMRRGWTGRPRRCWRSWRGSSWQTPWGSREPGEELGGLPDLEVRGLQNEDARGLLHSVVRVRLDEQVRDRILAETKGNPLALLELPRAVVGDPHTTMVSSAMPSSSSLSRITPVKSSIWVSRSAQFPRLVLPAYSGSGIGLWRVPLAPHPGGVADVGQRPGDRDLPAGHPVGPAGNIHALRAGADRVASGQQGRAARRTLRLDAEVQQLEALAGQGIDPRRGRPRSTPPP